MTLPPATPAPTMWAQRLVAPGRFAEVQTPRPLAGDLDEGEVLLRVLAGGICGSDLPAFAGTPPPHLGQTGGDGPGAAGFPMHEVVGEVLASTDPDIAVGSRVVGWASRFDAIAGYTITRGDDVAPFDPALAPEHAIMLQPLACVLYAVDQVLPVRGCRVAVLGLGPIGLLFTRVLADSSASRVTGVDTVDRRGVARAVGIDDPVAAHTGGPDPSSVSSSPVAVVLDHSALLALGAGNRLLSGLVARAHAEPDSYVFVPALCLTAAVARRPGLADHIGVLPALHVVDLDHPGAAAVGGFVAAGVEWGAAQAIVDARATAQWPSGRPVLSTTPEIYDGWGVRAVRVP